MITIPLKPNNRPTQPGTYIVLRPGNLTTPETARVWKEGKILYVSTGLTITALNKLEPDCLWSEQVRFEQ